MSLSILPDKPLGSKCYSNWELREPLSIIKSEHELLGKILEYLDGSGYTEQELRWVPFEQYDRREVWNRGRETTVRERVLNKQTLTPILLGLYQENTEATAIYGLHDGIHRSNVLFDYGYTHILATVHIEVQGREPFIEEEIKGDREQIFKYCLMNNALKTLYGIHGINIGNVYICLPNYEYDIKLSRREYRQLLFTKRHIVNFALGKKGITNNSLEVIGMVNKDEFNVVLQISNEIFKLNGTLDKLADELEQLIRKNSLFSRKIKF